MRRTLIITLLLVSLPALALDLRAQPGARAPSAPDLQRVATVLRSQRDPAAPAPEVLAAELAREARGLRPELLQLLYEQRVPGKEDEPPQAMSELQRELLLELLAQPPRASSRDALRGLLELHDEPRAHLVAVLALGRIGSARDLPALLAHAREGAAPEPRRGECALLESAVASLLRREPAAVDALASSREDIEPALLPPILRGVGASGVVEGLGFVLDCMESTPALELLCLAQVQRLGPTGDHTRDEAARAEVRKLLDPEHPARCRAAALACGALVDVEAAPSLLELLDHPEPGVVADAGWSLRCISRQPFPAERHIWQRWYEEQRDWRSSCWEGTVDGLFDANAGVVAGAVAALVDHPLYRYECVPELAAMLDSADPTLERLACLAAGQLGLDVLRGRLETLLEVAEEPVRAAASRAVQRLGSE